MMVDRVGDGKPDTGGKVQVQHRQLSDQPRHCRKTRMKNVDDLKAIMSNLFIAYFFTQGKPKQLKTGFH